MTVARDYSLPPVDKALSGLVVFGILPLAGALANHASKRPGPATSPSLAGPLVSQAYGLRRRSGSSRCRRTHDNGRQVPVPTRTGIPHIPGTARQAKRETRATLTSLWGAHGYARQLCRTGHSQEHGKDSRDLPRHSSKRCPDRAKQPGLKLRA